MKQLSILFIIMFSVSSCVSSKKYESLESEYERLEQEHFQLAKKYDSMAESYEKMYYDYTNSEELRNIIEHTKERVKKLKTDVLIYVDKNVYELDNDIYQIERALDGWDF